MSYFGYASRSHSRTPSRNSQSSPSLPQEFLQPQQQTPLINPRPPPVESVEQRELSRKINRLGEIGVDKYIDLPQLVVVGDQSSGKSSVLEALTELPFPRDSGLCTRFATKVSFIRNESLDGGSVVTVSVTAADDGDGKIPEEKRARIEQFTRKLVLKDNDELSAEMFIEWFAGASKVMGIPGPGELFDSDTHVASFSSDILCISIEGPDKQNLTVTDLPGLIKTATQHQTDYDIAQIKKLTMDHISRPKSIILCVLSANVDVANQSVLQYAKEVDKKGERTLGVITKPDLVDRGGEGTVLMTARNKVKELELGYFVVCNRGAQDLNEGTTIDSRHAKEVAFFRRSPWNTLSPDRLGIDSLRNYLSQLQYKQFCSALPQIVAAIDTELMKSAEELDALGQARDTTEAQRLYLMKFAFKAEKLAGQALNGTITLEAKEKVTEEMKLHIHMRSLFKNISIRMTGLGNARPFLGTDGTLEAEEGPGATLMKGSLQLNSESDPLETLKWIEARRTASLPLDSMGGGYNPQLLRELFNDMSENWSHLAMFELATAKKHVKIFNEALVDHILPPTLHRHANSMLRRKLKSEHEKLFKKAEKELKRLLDDERESVALVTQSDYYYKLARELKQERVKTMVRRGQSSKQPMSAKPSHPTGTISQHGLHTPTPESRSPSRQVHAAAGGANLGVGQSPTPPTYPPHMLTPNQSWTYENPSRYGLSDNDDEYPQQEENVESVLEKVQSTIIKNEDLDTVLEVHDYLKAYYRIARKRFVDNLILQVIERRLLRPLPEIFGPKWLSGLQDPDLQRIAGEEPSVAAARERLKLKLERLEEAKTYLDEAPITITVSSVA